VPDGNAYGLLARPLLRWSSARDCVRKSIYEAEGAPARERTPAEEGTLWRGKSIGRDYTIFLATQQQTTIFVESGPHHWVPPELRAKTIEDAGIVAEQRIRWRYGVGHADIYLPDTRTIVEVLSSAHVSDEMRHAKLLQAVGYCEHHPQAENCALIVVSPTDFTSERVVLVSTSRQYRDLRDEVRERIEQVRAWDEDGLLPERVCSKPSEARGHFCVFAAHCFEGWQAPEPEAFAADETLVEAVREFDECKRAISARKPELDDLEKRKNAAQNIIEAAELPAKRTVRVGPFDVTRTAVQRKPTFDAEAAEMAGRFAPEAVLEFFKPGASYSTFKAERVPGVEDFGEVPF